MEPERQVIDDDRERLIPNSSENNTNNMRNNENQINLDNQNNNQSQSPPWSRRRIIVTVVRSTLVFVGLIIVFLNTLFGFVLPSGDIDCVVDYTHKGTSSINQSLQDNPGLRKALMIISALALDVLFLIKIGYFIFKSKTWRLIVSIIAFFLIRSIAQVIFQEKFPEGYAWYYPGFPSITVSYLKANDFYFNSSTGLMLICALDFYYEKQIIYFALSLCSILFQSLLLIFLRGQYIIDIFSSLVIAHFVVLNVSDYIHYLDHNKHIGFYVEKSDDDLKEEKKDE
jgi:hypothetical protein